MENAFPTGPGDMAHLQYREERTSKCEVNRA